jgi:hypothetical protein
MHWPSRWWAGLPSGTTRTGVAARLKFARPNSGGPCSQTPKASVTRQGSQGRQRGHTGQLLSSGQNAFFEASGPWHSAERKENLLHFGASAGVGDAPQKRVAPFFRLPTSWCWDSGQPSATAER